MNFFETLATQENVDLNLRIMGKNGKLTLNIMPGSDRSATKPILITGTGAELDAEFFNSILPEVQEVKGIVSNIAEVKKDSEKALANAKEKKAAKPAAPSKKPADKSGKKKPVAAAEPDLFGGDKTETDDDTAEDSAGSDDE